MFYIFSKHIVAKITLTNLYIFARAKRGRVVQNEYEKANCRPTRHGHPRVGQWNRRQLLIWNGSIFDENWPNLGPLLIWNRSIFDEKWRNWGPLLISNRSIFDEKWRNWGPLLIWNGSIFDENWRNRRPLLISNGSIFNDNFANPCSRGLLLLRKGSNSSLPSASMQPRPTPSKGHARSRKPSSNVTSKRWLIPREAFYHVLP